MTASVIHVEIPVGDVATNRHPVGVFPSDPTAAMPDGD